MRHVLLSWKQDLDGDAPFELIYLLEHKYSQANLGGSALKGRDAQIVALLDLLAKQIDFRLGLANVLCRVSGYADDPGYRESSWGRGYSSDEDADEADEYVGMGEVEETSLSIENMVDLEGTLIRKDLDFDFETEGMLEDLDEVLQEGTYDKQEYEGYLGNGAGSLERWYRRTVLVIWPRSNHYDIILGADRLNYACDKIKNTAST